MGRLSRLRFVRVLFSVACLCVFQLSVASNSASATGPLLNDVGDGAFLWGASNERTTYLQPYHSLMAPKIARIPEDNLASDPLRTRDRNRAELWKTTQEVGTVFGTDGRLYRYHYERGVEPRRVIESRVIDGRAVAVERIVWEPVLIRVLEPATGRVGSVNASSSQPRPCDPLGPCDPALPTSESSNNNVSNNPNANASNQPTLNADSRDSSMNQGASTVSSNDDVIALSITSYDPGAYPASAPIITSPRNATSPRNSR